MPVWDVTEPFISLWLHDEPLGYQPAIGARISFKASFGQREVAAGYSPSVFSLGKRWNCSWLSYVVRDQSGSNVVYYPGGGNRRYGGTNDYLTNTKLTGDITNGFTVVHPDGSKNIYGLMVTNGSGVFQKAFLTELWNAQSQKTLFRYAAYNPASPVVRLQYVIDGDGRTNTLTYVTNNAYSTNLIAKVTDPFGRSCTLLYDNNGRLTNITDVASLSSSPQYDASDRVSGLVTPYGITTFNFTDVAEANGRSVNVTHPDGAHDLFFYSDQATGVANSYATNQIPGTSPFTNTFDNASLNVRNTFHWGPRQYAALSTTNLWSLTANDFRLARMQHWLLGGSATNVGSTVSLTREPSPDGAGTIEGQKIWYDYAGKTNSAYEGTQALPLFAAYVLPDGTTAFTRTERNSLGAVTAEISTYSAGGGIALRTNLFAYATNHIDLIAVTNALGVLVSSNSYNDYHQVLTHFDAVRELTSYTYNTNQQPLTVTLPTGLVVTNIYGADNFPAEQIAIGFATNSFTWANDLVQTHTDPRGLTTTHTWDALNRPTSTVFPGGSSVSNNYTFLDLTATKDRLDHWTYFGFDKLRRNTSITNALNNVTTFSYCTCGALESTVDALSQPTFFYYDNQGNRTNVNFPDGSSLTYQFDLVGRRVTITDGAGRALRSVYNNQGLVTVVSNAYGTLQSATFDILDRPVVVTDENNVTVTNTFDALNRVVKKTWMDGTTEGLGWSARGLMFYTNQLNQVTRFGRDAAGRKVAVTNANNEVVLTGYNAAGDVTSLTDGLNHTVTFQFNEYGWLTNKVDGLNRTAFRYAYNANGWLTNRWTPEKGDTGYAYDAVGNRTAIHYPSATISYSFAALNQLTSMVDAVGTHSFSWTATGQLASENGAWASDTVSYTYAHSLRTAMAINQPSSSWSQTYSFDNAWRMTGVTSPAGGFLYGYGTPNTASALVRNIALPNGASITNSYDPLARLKSTALVNHWGHALDGYTYALDASGMRTNITRDFGLAISTVAAGYDNIGQLTSWTAQETNGVVRQNEKLGWAYDAAGNLNLRTNGALVQLFAVDAANQLTNVTRTGTLTVSGNTPAPVTSVTVNGLTAQNYEDLTFARTNLTLANGNNSFTNIAQNIYGVKATNIVTLNLLTTVTMGYDNNGNLTNDGLRSLAYDAENQITNVMVAGAWKSEFVYDGLNRRRISRDYTWNGSAWTQTNEVRFIYDGYLPVQERDTNNNVLVTYTRGLDMSGTLADAGGIGGLLARTDTNGSAYYHADGSGNITALMDGRENIVARYLYNPFGKLAGKWGTLADANVMRFSSKLYHPLADDYDFGFRRYRPDLPGWTTTDPIQEAGGINLYQFVYNDPINFIDPNGENPRLVALINRLGNTAAGQWLQRQGDKAVNLGVKGVQNAWQYGKNLFGKEPKPSLLVPCNNPVAAETTPKLLNPGINVTEQGMQHVLERHIVNGISEFASKSKFTTGVNLEGLIQQGTQIPMVRQVNGNFVRTFDAGRAIGIDRATGQASSTVTIITGPNGNLVTMFPGVP